MTTELPPLLAAYVHAKNAHDADALLSCFTSDAVVHDEGREIRGTDAIKEWIDMVNEKYQVHLDVTGVSEREGVTVLSALVSGSFDGSPIPFDYHMTIRDDKIAVLSVQ